MSKIWLLGISLIAAGAVILLLVTTVALLERRRPPAFAESDLAAPAPPLPTILLPTAEGAAAEASQPEIILPTPIGAEYFASVSRPPASGFSPPAILPQSPLAERATTGGGGAVPTVQGQGVDAASLPQRLIIPAIDVDAPVYSVGLERHFEGDQSYLQWSVPRGYAVGWHNQSAPLGAPGNTVLNGHNNIYGSVFRDLVDLAPGDRVILYDAGVEHVYQVAQRELLEEQGQPLAVRYQNARWMLPTTDERITIISCWPATSNSHRVIVVAVPVVDAG